MKVKFYGTRGSIPIANKESVKYGGNTTCVRIFDECLPDDMVLAIDSGSGFVPLAKNVIKEGNKDEVLILYRHGKLKSTLEEQSKMDVLTPSTFRKIDALHLEEHSKMEVLTPKRDDFRTDNLFTMILEEPNKLKILNDN